MKYVKVKVKTNMLLSIIFTFFLLWTPALFNSGCAYLLYKGNIGLNWVKTKKRKTYCGLLIDRKTNKKLCVLPIHQNHGTIIVPC